MGAERKRGVNKRGQAGKASPSMRVAGGHHLLSSSRDPLKVPVSRLPTRDLETHVSGFRPPVGAHFLTLKEAKSGGNLPPRLVFFYHSDGGQNRAPVIPMSGNDRSGLRLASGEMNQILNSVGNSSGPSVGASSLVTDANSGLSGGPQLQKSTSFNNESYMGLPASPISFSSNFSGSSVMDGCSIVQQSSLQEQERITNAAAAAAEVGSSDAWEGIAVADRWEAALIATVAGSVISNGCTVKSSCRLQRRRADAAVVTAVAKKRSLRKGEGDTNDGSGRWCDRGLGLLRLLLMTAAIKCR
ncbi:hypothetical protein BHE74_00025091 [Ensete ventricosum]|nr:hypothetical protein BHE74_00025091 [Ensete ventricosum]